MQITLKTGTTTLHATLNNTVAARDFAAMLPVTVTLSDFHATEKVADLPGKLSTTGSPKGTDAKRGDITYYSPWGNLAIFYRDFEYAPGLVNLGHIDSELDWLTAVADGTTVTISATT